MIVDRSTWDAERAYDELAPDYDAFTADHDYELWTGRLVDLAGVHGLAGTRLLDVGCGTGKSFAPLLDAGWSVTGCDRSAAMLAHAGERGRGRADLCVADARALPALGEFDLVWALCDVANYMHDAFELAAFLEGLRRNLAPGGLALFDANTLWSYRGFFADQVTVELDGRTLEWRGQVDSDTFASGDRAHAEIHTFVESGGERVLAGVSRHRQRHHPFELVAALARDSGLRILGCLGQDYEVHIDPVLDEEHHSKAIYVASAANQPGRG